VRIPSGVLIAVLACGWLLGTPPAASARRCKDDEACRSCFDRTLSLVEDCEEADTLIENRQSRTETFNVQYGICAELVPGRPGSCRLTIQGLNKCLRTRKVSINRSWTTFKGNARRECGRKAVRKADRARRQCLRDEACPCNAPTTTTTSTTTTTTTSTMSTSTTTTTTTTSTTTTTTAATMGVVRGGTTSTTTTSTTSTSSTTPVPATPDGSTCQQACIKRVARGCYSDCASSCGNSTGALPKCQRACRNAQCATLRKLCAPTPDTDFDSNNPQGLNQDYFACCKINGTCDADDEDTLSCVTTTTTTSTTSTSSTSSTSTSSTLFTTTTLFPTTTLIPTTTTTTLNIPL
jgi:hypothetical protein